MAVTTDGIMTTALASVRTVLSESETFQALVGASDASEALAYIHYGRVVPGDRPFALVSLAEWEYQRVAGGAKSHFRPVSGAVAVLIAADISTEYVGDAGDAPENAYLEFLNRLEGVVVDLAAIAGVNQNLPIRHVGFWDEPPMLSGLNENDDYYFEWLILGWGGG